MGKIGKDDRTHSRCTVRASKRKIKLVLSERYIHYLINYNHHNILHCNGHYLTNHEQLKIWMSKSICAK